MCELAQFAVAQVPGEYARRHVPHAIRRDSQQLHLETAPRVMLAEGFDSRLSVEAPRLFFLPAPRKWTRASQHHIPDPEAIRREPASALKSLLGWPHQSEGLRHFTTRVRPRCSARHDGIDF